jgi:hypothetical protein
VIPDLLVPGFTGKGSSFSAKTIAVFHYLMQRGEPATRNEIAAATGYPNHAVNNALQCNPTLFVRAGGDRKQYLWAAWEE